MCFFRDVRYDRDRNIQSGYSERKREIRRYSGFISKKKVGESVLILFILMHQKDMQGLCIW